MTLQAITPPSGVFQGKNFMTPNVLGYFKLRPGYGYAELSEGRGMDGERIFGVTVRPDRTMGRLFHSRADAQEYILSLSTGGAS